MARKPASQIVKVVVSPGAAIKTANKIGGNTVTVLENTSGSEYVENYLVTGQ